MSGPIQWVRRWHWGQLLLAWIALAVFWLMFAILNLALTGTANRIEGRAQEAVRDRAARNPANLKRIRDSVDNLVAAGTPRYEIDDYIVRSEGLQPNSFVPPTKAEVWHGTAARVAGYLAGSSLILIPVIAFAMTWVWFGGRQQSKPNV